MYNYTILSAEGVAILDISPENGYAISESTSEPNAVNIGASPIAGGIGTTVTAMSIPSRNHDFVGAVAWGDHDKKVTLAGVLYPRREIYVETRRNDKLYKIHGYVYIPPTFNGYRFTFSIYSDTGKWEEEDSTSVSVPSEGETISTGCTMPVQFWLQGVWNVIIATETHTLKVIIKDQQTGRESVARADIPNNAVTNNTPFKIYRETDGNVYIKFDGALLPFKAEQNNYVSLLNPETHIEAKIDESGIPVTVHYNKAWGSVI